MSAFSIRSSLVAAAVIFGSTIVAPASAFFIVGVSVTNTYSYSFGDTAGSTINVGEQSKVLSSDQRPIPTSQLGVDLVGQANSDSFYFLHNDYCVGKCQITSSTTIRFELYNEERDIDDLRFQSLITPGHLALVALGSYENTAASFSFSVDRTDLSPFGSPSDPVNLYTATGSSGIGGLTVEANGVKDPFNNTITGTNGGAGSYYDWSATPLDVDVGAFSSNSGHIFIDYTASYTVQSFNTCDDVLNCNAAQVVFGDPRTTGGGTTSLVNSLAQGLFAGGTEKTNLGSDPTIDGGVHAVITRDYDSFNVPYAFVASGTDPTFTVPDPEAPITYVGNYIPNLIDTGGSPAVPEPATWASMVLGFGVAGSALRGRRARPEHGV